MCGTIESPTTIVGQVALKILQLPETKAQEIIVNLIKAGHKPSSLAPPTANVLGKSRDAEQCKFGTAPADPAPAPGKMHRLRQLRLRLRARTSETRLIDMGEHESPLDAQLFCICVNNTLT